MKLYQRKTQVKLYQGKNNNIKLKLAAWGQKARVNGLNGTTIYEPSRGKTNNVVSEQVRHKPACTCTRIEKS